MASLGESGDGVRIGSNKVIVLGIAAITILVVILAGFLVIGRTTSGQASSQATPSQESSERPETGKSATVGEWTVTVENAFVKRGASGSTHAHSAYLHMTITVRNNGKSAQHAPSFSLRDGLGNEYRASDALYTDDPGTGLLAGIGAHLTQTGTVAFEVQDTPQYSLIVRTGAIFGTHDEIPIQVQ